MTPRRAFRESLQFLVVTTFFALGLFLSLLPYTPRTKERLINTLQNHPDIFLKVGIGVVLASLTLLFAFLSANRGRYLVIRMGAKTHLSIIKHAVENCFKENFPQKIALKEVDLDSKSHLQFSINITPESEAQSEELYKEVEKELQVLLAERFGYSKTFDLISKIS